MLQHFVYLLVGLLSFSYLGAGPLIVGIPLGILECKLTGLNFSAKAAWQLGFMAHIVLAVAYVIGRAIIELIQ